MKKKLAILIVIGIALTGLTFVDTVKSDPKTTVQPVKPTAKIEAPNPSDIDITYLNTEVNNYRKTQGNQPLSINSNLTLSASDKCTDMAQKKYWAHNSPDGKTPWAFIQKYQPQYHKAGENLAKRLTTANGVFYAWVDSPEHRENLLDGEFNSVGYAVCSIADTEDSSGTSLMVVQHLAAL